VVLARGPEWGPDRVGVAQLVQERDRAPDPVLVEFPVLVDRGRVSVAAEDFTRPAAEVGPEAAQGAELELAGEAQLAAERVSGPDLAQGRRDR
jgi:hypothetical protein